MYKFAFIEDNDNDFASLEEAIYKYSAESDVEIEMTRFNNGEVFLEHYQIGMFDAVFFDIILGDNHINGLDVARKLYEIDPNVSILFLTNMAQYAINGYEVNAVDYIVKPIKYYDFLLKIQKLIRSLRTSQKQLVSFKSEGETVILNEDEILYVVVTAHYLSIYTDNKEYIVREPLKKFENKLSSNFARSGISYLINISKIEKIHVNDVIVNGKIIPLTRLYKKEFLEKVNKHMALRSK